MNKLVQHRDLITHYAALTIGITLTTVGAYLSFLATTALSGREVANGLTHIKASWMCIVPAVTCVIMGGLVLIRTSRAKTTD